MSDPCAFRTQTETARAALILQARQAKDAAQWQ